MTLIDSYSTVLEIHKFTAKKFYHFDLEEKDLRENWGIPTHELFPKIYQNRDTYENLYKKVTETREKDIFKFKPFPEVIETLEKLKEQYYLGIVTAFDSVMATRTIEAAGINVELFNFVQGNDHTQFHKPDPRVFEPALKKLAEKGITNKEILYVGDAIRDYQAAKGADLNFVAVTTGFDDQKSFIESGLDSKLVVKRLSDLLLLF